MAYSQGYARRVHRVMKGIYQAGSDGQRHTLSSVIDQVAPDEERSDVEQTIAIMAQVGYLDIQGEGNALAYTVTPQGLKA